MPRRNRDALQRQVWNDAVDQFITTKQCFCIATRGDDGRICPVMIGIVFGKNPNEPLDAEVHALEHGLRRAAAEGLGFWNCKFQIGQRLGVLVQRAKLHPTAWRNGAAMEDAFTIHEVHSHRSPRVNHDAGLLEHVKRGCRIEQPVHSCDGLRCQITLNGNG